MSATDAPSKWRSRTTSRCRGSSASTAAASRSCTSARAGELVGGGLASSRTRPIGPWTRLRLAREHALAVCHVSRARAAPRPARSGSPYRAKRAVRPATDAPCPRGARQNARTPLGRGRRGPPSAGTSARARRRAHRSSARSASRCEGVFMPPPVTTKHGLEVSALSRNSVGRPRPRRHPLRTRRCAAAARGQMPRPTGTALAGRAARCAATDRQCRVRSLPARLEGERAGSERKCCLTRATENARVRCEGPAARRGPSARDVT